MISSQKRNEFILSFHPYIHHFMGNNISCISFGGSTARGEQDVGGVGVMARLKERDSLRCSVTSHVQFYVILVQNRKITGLPFFTRVPGSKCDHGYFVPICGRRFTTGFAGQP
jgi:hypothetical protein